MAKPPAEPKQMPGARGRRPVAELFAAAGPLVGLLFIVLIFFLYDLADDFVASDGLRKFLLVFDASNMKLVAVQSTIVGVAALGMTIVIVSGGIDLSTGSSIALGTVVIALGMTGIPWAGGNEPIVIGTFAALVAGVVTCSIAGAVNGIVITGFRIVPFIVTLGMMSVARGLAKLFAAENKIPCDETWVSRALWVDRSPGAHIWELPWGVWLLIALAAATWALLRFTVFGRHIFAIGSNERTAILCGVKVSRSKVAIYSLAGFFTGIAAVLEFSTLNSGDPTTSVGKELDVIAAVVIGGGSLAGGKGSIPGTLAGAFIIGLLRNACVLYDLPNTVQEIAIGVIIVSAAAMDRIHSRRVGA